MKAVKIIGLTLLCFVVITVIAGFVFIKTFDLNKYKKPLLDQARKVLQRDVDFDRADLDLSLKNGARLRLSGFSMAEDPAFGEGDMVRVASVYVGLDLWTLVSKKQISVPALSVEGLKLSVVRDKEGRINLMAPIAASAADAGKSEASGVPVSQALAVPMIFVRQATFQGEVTYEDHTFDPPMKVDVSRINASAKDVSLTEPFSVAIEAALFSDTPDMKAQAKVKLDMASSGALLSDVKIDADLGKISQERLRSSLPMLSSVPAWQELKGLLALDASRIRIGKDGLSDLEAIVKFSDGSLKLKDVVAITGVKVQCLATTAQIDMQEFFMKVGQGQVSGTGSLKDYLTSPTYTGNLTMDGLEIQELLDQSAWPAKGEGIVAGSLRLQGQSFEPKTAMSRLGGEGRFDVSQARIKDINALSLVLSKISVIPNIAQRIEASLPDRFKDKLRSPDTVFSSMRFSVTISEGALRADPLVVAADEFSFEGTGRFGFDQTIDVSGTFAIPADLSASMTAGVPELKYLVDLRNRISLPVAVKGPASAARFSVDTGDLAKRILIAEGTRQLGQILGGNDASSTSVASVPTQDALSAAAPTAEMSTVSVEEKIVSRVLGTILGSQSGQEGDTATAPVS